MVREKFVFCFVPELSASPSHPAYRQSWPTRVDVHQDIGDSLGGPSISHPGGPQSPARSAESLHNGPRPKTALLDLNQRRQNDSNAPPSAGPSLQPGIQNQGRGLRPQGKPHTNHLRLGSLAPSAPSKPRSPSLFSVEEDEEEDGKQEEDSSSPSAIPAQVVLRCKAPSLSSSTNNRLASRKSAPILNQIHEEEREEEEERKECGSKRAPAPPTKPTDRKSVV